LKIQPHHKIELPSPKHKSQSVLFCCKTRSVRARSVIARPPWLSGCWSHGHRRPPVLPPDGHMAQVIAWHFCARRRGITNVDYWTDYLADNDQAKRSNSEPFLWESYYQWPT